MQIDYSPSAKERRAMILKMLDQENEVSVTKLSKKLGISEVTIRKDLTLLQSKSLLVRTRGGAIRRPVENLNEDTAISRKSMFNFHEKARIGKLATKLIKDGDYIMLDSGTTTLEIAKNLGEFQNLSIVTNALNIAEELMKYNRSSKESSNILDGFKAPEPPKPLSTGGQIETYNGKIYYLNICFRHFFSIFTILLNSF